MSGKPYGEERMPEGKESTFEGRDNGAFEDDDMGSHTCVEGEGKYVITLHNYGNSFKSGDLPDSEHCSVKSLDKPNCEHSSVKSLDRPDSEHSSVKSLDRPDSEHSSVKSLDRPDSEHSSVKSLDRPDSEHSSIKSLDRPDSEHSSVKSLDRPDSEHSESEVIPGIDVNPRQTHVLQIGIWYTLVSAVLMALCGMAIAYLSGSVGPNQIVVSRMTVQLLCCLPVDAYRRVSFKHSRTAYFLLLLRSLLGTIVTSLMYITYQIMPVSSAKSIQYSTPVFAGLLGWILLKESYSFVDTLFSFLTLGGVFLIAQPPFLFTAAAPVETASNASVLGSTLSLLCALLSAIILIIMRKLGSYSMTSLTMLTVYSIIGAFFAASLTSILQQWTLPGCGADRIILLGNGIGFFMSQILIYLALKTERASTVALVHSSDILFSFVLEYIFFGVVPNYFTAIGACVIIASFVGITLKKWLNSRQQNDDLHDKDKGSDTSISGSEHGSTIDKNLHVRGDFPDADSTENDREE